MGKPKESVEASGVQIGSILSFSGAARFELIDGTRADTTQMGFPPVCRREVSFALQCKATRSLGRRFVLEIQKAGFQCRFQEPELLK
jgi:hypothetical protein